MRKHSSASMLAKLWGFNILLLLSVFGVQLGSEYFKSSVLEYSNIQADPFDGAVAPIRYVPNWLTVSTQNKALRFSDIPVSSFIELPAYDPELLLDSDASNKMASLARSEYITAYMGSYRMNYTEYDGSHLGVDIRAPLGTPVLSVANGVVVKVNDTETSDGKYVIIRHENVTYKGQTQDYYSSYLHLESSSVQAGTKVSKGQVIGKVGLTGITTTPHLHFQIDKADAPFHAYWPYSYADIKALNLDFFSAVNVGLGKENAIQYTANPMEFVQDLKNGSSSSVATKPVLVASASDAATNASIPKPSTPVQEVDKEVSNPSSTTVDTEDEDEEVVNEAPKWTPTTARPFKDVAPGSFYYDATKILFSLGVSKGMDDGSFGIEKSITRREAIVLLGRGYKVAQKEYDVLPFNDITSSDAAAGYLGTMVDNEIVSPLPQFRPDDTITRGESIILMTRLAKLSLADKVRVSYFRDIKANDSRAKYFNAYSEQFKVKRNTKLAPDTIITRGEFAQILVQFLQK